MNVAGIDYSSYAIDVVLLDEDTDQAAWHRFPLEGIDAFDRTRQVRAAMPTRSWWEDNAVIATGIEQPRGYGAGHLYRIQGAILGCLPNGLLVYPVIPSSWRTLCGLKGNATKSVVRARSIELLSADYSGARVITWDGTEWTQDAHDAHLIAYATSSVIERTEAA